MMPADICAVSETDHRNRYRVGKCGKYRRSAESVARQKAKLAASWDTAARARQGAITKARMAMPGVSERIATRTAAALANPEVKQRQRDGLARAWDDPAKRARHAEITKTAMAKWRAECLLAAETVLRQLPRADRDAAMAGLASAAHSGPTP